MRERPHCCPSWAPGPETPVLQYHLNWKALAAMGGAIWPRITHIMARFRTLGFIE